MLSGKVMVLQQIGIIILYVNRYCVPMDDHRPMSGGEKVFFSSGTGSGIFVIYFFLNVSDNFYSSSACCAYFHQV
jgi:hypothetical protein